jgi:hypothetical protein
VRAAQITIPEGGNNATTVLCPADERAIGGGVRFIPFNAPATPGDLTIASSRPVSDGGDPQVPNGQTLTGCEVRRRTGLAALAPPASSSTCCASAPRLNEAIAGGAPVPGRPGCRL